MELTPSSHTQETHDEEFYVVCLHDYIPIIGTVKSTCEAVAALCLGDTKTAADKGIDVDETIISEFLVVKGTDEENAGIILQTVLESRKKEGTEEARDTTRLVDAKKMTFGNLSEQRLLRKTALIPAAMKSPSKPPSEHKRGEHVINNGVLKVYRNIRQMFIEKVHGKGSMDPPKDPFTPDCSRAIGSLMVVYFDKNQHYIDPNSVLFGEKMKQLTGMALLYMLCVLHKDGKGISSGERDIKNFVSEIIEKRVFIDELALKKWREGGQRNMSMFEKAKGQVEEMYRNLAYHHNKDLLIEWVKELAGQS